MSNSNNEYVFLKKGDELAGELSKRVWDYQDYVLRAGIYTQWRKNQAYYENDFYGTGKSVDIADAGSVGELKASSFNHYRNVLRHMLNQLTSITPAYDVSAANTSVASRRSSKIGKHVVDYYFKVKRVSKYSKKCAEYALIHGDGSVVCEWNPTIGKNVGKAKNGRFVKEGDFDFSTVVVYDSFYDYSLNTRDNLEWFIFRKKRNKFDLAKIFPKKAKELIALTPYYESDLYEQRRENSKEYGIDTDNVYIYSFYHKQNNCLEKGKYAMFVGGGSDTAFMLYEGDNPYVNQLPIFTLSPAEYLDSPFGFTEANLLRGPQEVINMMVSALITNSANLSVNNLWAPTGSNLNVQELTDGMNYIQSDQKPEVISFFQNDPGLKDLLLLCNSTIETLSGQNAVVRGNVQDAPNLKSGIAISTVANMAQQYSISLEKAYVEMFEDMATFLLTTLKKFANTERLIDITGKMQATSVHSFTKDDLEGVSRVIVDQVNPIAKQPAGKIEIAMELLKLGQITPVEFFDVVNTGNLDVAVESDEKMLDFIASTKELLLEGQEIPPIPGINHQVYIKEIHSLLYDVDILNNPNNQQIMQNIVKTIQQQLDIVRNGDEIANLIYGGKSPTPTSISAGEVAIPPALTDETARQGQPPLQ